MNKTHNIVMTMLGLATSLCAAEPWTMHKIDNAMWNHNSLSPGDLNGDGYADYAGPQGFQDPSLRVNRRPGKP